jgi:hypothetical protein
MEEEAFQLDLDGHEKVQENGMKHGEKKTQK